MMPHHLQRRAWRGSLLAMVLGLSGCAFHVTERAVIRPTPDPVDAPTPATAFADVPASMSEHAIDRGDGVQLHGVLLRQAGASRTLLYFGGNLSRVSEGGPTLAQRLLPLGLNLFLVDHRGSGRSSGTPTIELLMDDALAAFDYLVDTQAVAPQQIIVYGHSLGSFKAGQVALQRPVGALVVSGSATTTEDWVRATIPWYAKPFVRTTIEPNMQGRGNLDVVQRQRAPLLIIVGEDDEQTPAKLSRKLGQAAQDKGYPVRVLVVEDANHNNVLSAAVTVETMRAFIASLN